MFLVKIANKGTSFMMKCSENAIAVFDILLTVQFFERSHVPVFFPDFTDIPCEFD